MALALQPADSTPPSAPPLHGLLWTPPSILLLNFALSFFPFLLVAAFSNWWERASNELQPASGWKENFVAFGRSQLFYNNFIWGVELRIWKQSGHGGHGGSGGPEGPEGLEGHGGHWAWRCIKQGLVLFGTPGLANAEAHLLTSSPPHPHTSTPPHLHNSSPHFHSNPLPTQYLPQVKRRNAKYQVGNNLNCIFVECGCPHVCLSVCRRMYSYGTRIRLGDFAQFI